MKIFSWKNFQVIYIYICTFFLQTQYRVNGGKCGVCGDSYSDPHPQDNENTGRYGKGIIAAKYQAGSVIDIKIKLTANHLGTFTYR